jgi:hypothetical protein
MEENPQERSEEKITVKKYPQILGKDGFLGRTLVSLGDYCKDDDRRVD